MLLPISTYEDYKLFNAVHRFNMFVEELNAKRLQKEMEESGFFEESDWDTINDDGWMEDRYLSELDEMSGVNDWNNNWR